MRRWAIVAACVISVGFVAFAALRPMQGWSPKAVTPTTSCQITAVVGEDASCEIVVRNRGFGTLILGGAQAPSGVRIEGAGGTNVGWLRGKTIRAVVDTNAIGGKGTIPIKVLTNDPNRREIALEVKFDIRAYLVARPGFARYIYVQQAGEGTVTQTIAATDGTPFKVLGVDSQMPQLRVSFHEATPAEQRPDMSGVQWIVQTTILNDAAVGAISGNLIVRTDHPKQKIVRIPVSGFVRPIFAVTPPVASLPAVDPVTTPEAELHVKNFAEEPIALTGASTTVRGISASIKTVEAGHVYYVVLKFAKDLPPGPFKGTVEIRTASPKIPVIKVPLDGTRQ